MAGLIRDCPVLIDAVDLSGLTALHRCAINTNLPIAKELLAVMTGAQIVQKSRKGETALDICTQSFSSSGELSNDPLRHEIALMILDKLFTKGVTLLK